MTFEEYREFLATAFPEAVAECRLSDEMRPQCLERLWKPISEHLHDWGFRCAADCFAAAVPRSARLTLNAWCEAEMTVDCWKVQVSSKPLIWGCNHTHLEIRSLDKSPLPFTGSGYRSHFVDLPSFSGNATIEDFVRAQFPKEPQLALF
jgi:hypothetical protein